MSRLVGCRMLVFVAVFSFIALAASAQTFTKLAGFNGTDGANPYVGLTQGRDGNLYGTTIDGGAYGAGNVFKISARGKLTSLYDFCAQTNCPDGQYPDTVLALGMDGNFYGTTQSGGMTNNGTVFKITADGQLTTLYSFNGNDGSAPYGSMVLTANGDFYGTTNVGGAFGGGNVFKITPNGVLTTLYTFCSQSGCTDGEYPVGPLIQGSDGNIYGTTHAGGNSSCTDGCGTVFTITPSGTLTTLHEFNASDGEYPYGGVVEGPKGSLYGTTGGGGANDAGTVFAMASNGRFATLHSFDVTDGATPYALMRASDGNFYGTTSAGGSNSRGTVFKITPRGRLTSLHSFEGSDGALVYAGLTQGTNGLFYGTTYFGGKEDDGTVFSLDVGLGPFVTFVVPAAKTGEVFGILGQGFHGTTSVLLNGTAAQFKVVSGTYIEARVPAGAGTGYIKVSTPSGTLTSNIPFHVIP